MRVNEAVRLRELLKEKDLLVGVGARDGLEAKLIENAGFDFIWASGFDVSASYALPDASLISMKQFLEEARAMRESVGIPIVADCDTGYGNVSNLIYAARLFEDAGIAAICIEDKKFPKDTSLLEGGRQELASIQEFVGKIRAAKAMQNHESFVVIARTEALIAGEGQESALARAERYADAGADLILVHSKSTTPDEVVSFSRRWKSPKPLVIIPTRYPQIDEQAVRDLKNVKMVIYANQVLRAGIKTQESVLRRMKEEGGIGGIEGELVSVEHVFDLQGVSRLKEDQKRYGG